MRRIPNRSVKCYEGKAGFFASVYGRKMGRVAEQPHDASSASQLLDAPSSTIYNTFTISTRTTKYYIICSIVSSCRTISKTGRNHANSQATTNRITQRGVSADNV